MIRFTVLTLALLASGAFAHPRFETPLAAVSSANVTIVYKNEAYPLMGPLVVEQCAKEDCSDVQD